MDHPRVQNSESYEDKAFVYEPLIGPEFTIRLLEVLPNHGHGPICVRISERTLWEAGSYRCLSYTWGELSGPKHDISLNGHSFSVNENLYQFLRMASDRMPRTPMWIDAISIDQNNDAEKGHQVSRMADIYHGAVETYIWLGDDAQIDAAIDILNSGTTQWRDEAVLNAITDLYNHPYWTRTWTCQEMLLSRLLTVLTSQSTLDWDKFRDAGKTRHKSLGWSDKQDPWLSANPEYFWSLWNKQPSVANFPEEGQHSLWDLLNNHYFSACADQRDHIYGLLALVQGGKNFPVYYSEHPDDLFWRCGDHFDAWSQPDRVGLLRLALRLDVHDLLESIPVTSSRRFYVPIQSAMTRSLVQSLRKRAACSNKKCELFQNIAELSRDDVLLCTRDDTNDSPTYHCLHVLLRTTTNSKQQAMELSVVPDERSGLFHSEILEPDALQHQTEQGWKSVTDVQYMKNHIKRKRLVGQWRLELPAHTALRLDRWSPSSGGRLYIPF